MTGPRLGPAPNVRADLGKTLPGCPLGQVLSRGVARGQLVPGLCLGNQGWLALEGHPRVAHHKHGHSGA